MKVNKLELLRELKEKLKLKFPNLDRVILFGSQSKKDKIQKL